MIKKIIEKKFKASAILVTFLIMMIILTIALSLALVTIKDMKGSIGSSKSNSAYQAADMGIEVVMYDILKNGKTKINELDHCISAGTYKGLIKDSDYIVQLLDESGNMIDCVSAGGDDISKIIKLKSIGITSNNAQKSERAIEVSIPRKTHIPFDFDGDGRSDLAIWHPNPNNDWLIHNSSTDDNTTVYSFGNQGSDAAVPGDYDGNGKADAAYFKKSDGKWYIGATSDPVDWGQNGDIPVPGDYDRDGKTDYAYWHPSDGKWHILNSKDGTTIVQQWGSDNGAAPDDIPVPGDYDGDGKTDYAVWRPSEGNWYIIKSSNGATVVKQWGVPTDIPVPGDYDGDGKTDYAVWRPSEGNWYITKSSNGDVVVKQWGVPTDIPVPGDYDGDGKTDYAVWRPSEGKWYIINSLDGSDVHPILGSSGDKPINVPIGYKFP